jgi:hypothetical protein
LVNTGMPPAKQRSYEATTPFQPQMPSTFRLILSVAKDAAVSTSPHAELKVPAEVLLPRLIVSLDACYTKACDHPLGEVIAKAAVVDEVFSHL